MAALPYQPKLGQTALQDPSLQKRMKVYNTLSLLGNMPSITVSQVDDCKSILVKSDYQFVPDWYFFWTEDYGYYRGYIHVARTDNGNVKVNAGYSICTVKSPLIAAAFIAAFSFFFRNRAFKVA